METTKGRWAPEACIFCFVLFRLSQLIYDSNDLYLEAENQYIVLLMKTSTGLSVEKREHY